MILALETSQPDASLCLAAADGGVLFRSSWRAERNHDAYLFPALQGALDARKAAGEALDLVLVGAGPGSYGGVRVALAAAVGISVVMGARTVAVGSWDALADEAGADACIISDARRGGWTFRRPGGSIEVLTTDELLARREAGARLLSIEPADKLAERGVDVERGGLVPTAEALVRHWLSLSEEARARLAARPAEPIYVRPPHITAAKRKPWETRS